MSDRLQGNLLLGALNSIRAVDDVAANSEGIVTTDRANGGGEGVGGTKHDTAGLDGIKTLPDHGDDGARGHVLDQSREEGLALEISVICGVQSITSPAFTRI